MAAETSPEDFTGLLRAWSEGDDDALAALVPLVYADLHRLARSYMRGERPDHTLQTTALVHEAFVRLQRAPRTSWQGRSHFLAVVARLMRHVLVDFARSRRAHKRGLDAPHVVFDEARDGAAETGPDLAALDAALGALALEDERKARVVELRFFGGFSVDETAEALGVSAETVMRDWRFARAWLLRALSDDPESAAGARW